MSLSLDPAMRMMSMLSAKHIRDVFPPSDCHSRNAVLLNAPSYFALRKFRKGLETINTTVNCYLANFDSSLQPFKCPIFGLAHAGALVYIDSITLPHLSKLYLILINKAIVHLG